MMRLREIYDSHGDLLGITAIISVHITSMMLMRHLVPLYLESLGSSSGTVGIVTALFSFLPLLLALPGGMATDSLGYRLIMVSGAIFLGAASLILVTSPGVFVVTLSQLLAGLGHILVILSGQAYVASMSEEEERSRNLAIFSTGFPIGFLLGPPLAGMLKDLWGFPVAFTVGAVLAAVVAVSSTRVRELKRPESGLRGFARTLKERLPDTLNDSLRLLKDPIFRVAVVVSMAILLVLTLRTSFLPIHLEGLGHSAFQTGFTVAMISTVSLLLRPLMGLILARLGSEILLALAFFVGTAGLVLMASVEGFWLSVVAAALFGVAPAFGLPLSLGLMSQRAPGDSQGMVMGLRQTANPIGLMAGPLIFGGVSTFWNTGVSFIVAGALLATVAFFLVLKRPLRSFGYAD
ncbi:MAG: MFS transporter [Clostridia bacterium]